MREELHSQCCFVAFIVRMLSMQGLYFHGFHKHAVAPGHFSHETSRSMKVER